MAGVIEDKKRKMLGLMSEPPKQVNPGRRRVGNLTDFVIGKEGDQRLDIEVAIQDNGRVVVFHSHPFRDGVSWFEFDLNTNKLDFILEDGDIRDVGLPLTQNVAKHMHNSHQILMVLMDPKTGEAKEGNYVPLIVHRK